VSRLIWTPAALRDVQRLRRFLAVKNADAARLPSMGRPVEEMEPEFREWPVSFGERGAFLVNAKMISKIDNTLAMKNFDCIFY
jgi:plasmid stabilization system protein ParE